MTRPAPWHPTLIFAASALLCGTAVMMPAASRAQGVSGVEALNGICRASIRRGDYQEALRLCKRVRFDAQKLAPESKEHIESLVNLGDIEALVENYVDADAYYAAALVLAERSAGPERAQVTQLQTTLVEIKVKRGKLLDAESLLKRLLAVREKAVGAADPGVAILRLRYADLLADSRLFVEAEAAYAQAIGVLKDNGRATVDAYASALLHLGELYERRALHARAEAQYRTLLQLVEREALGDPLLAISLERLGHVCEVLGNLTEATVFYQRVMRLLSTARLAPESERRIQTKLAELASLSSRSPP